MTCFSFLFNKKRAPRQQTDEDLLGSGHINIYSYKELKNATGDFSAINKIGEGGFGPVYKGTLKDGKVVAIKVLSTESTQGVREFMNEVTAISDVVHENLVRLYGCCVEGNHRILVYNYLRNNSLAQTLLGSGQSNILFNWRARVKICLGVARGLQFLHEVANPRIVHRDIKASNILLDEDLTPKISDFGLAKLLPPNTTHITTRVAGTLGYLAPEYAVRGQVTRKSDVYSFGVLLLEVVSGRCNMNTKLAYEDQFLLERTWALYERGELENIIDASLGNDLDVKQACRFLKVGLICTQDASKARPYMSTVVKMLTGEIGIDLEISKPAVINDVMDLRIRSQKRTIEFPTSSSLLSSGIPDSEETSDGSPRASTTFTAIADPGSQ